MSDLKLILVSQRAIPVSLKRVSLEEDYETRWVLKASGGPLKTVFLRYSTAGGGYGNLDVITPEGKRLHAVRKAPFSDSPPDLRLKALLLPGGGVLLRWDEFRAEYKITDRYFAAFPDRLAGACVVGQIDSEVKRPVWNGVGFVESGRKRAPDVVVAGPPSALPRSRYGEIARVAVSVFGQHRYLLRWAGERLEVCRATGGLIAAHRLENSFSADPDNSLSALWLNDRLSRGPILQARDSDSVYLHVFSDDFKRLLCVQHFSDASSSISATTVELSRDRRGLLVVTESYSERGEEGEGASSRTEYYWDGHGFTSRK